MIRIKHERIVAIDHEGWIKLHKETKKQSCLNNTGLRDRNGSRGATTHFREKVMVSFIEHINVCILYMLIRKASIIGALKM